MIRVLNNIREIPKKSHRTPNSYACNFLHCVHEHLFSANVLIANSLQKMRMGWAKFFHDSFVIIGMMTTVVVSFLVTV